MSCSCTANCDLISIPPLVLSDTFHTWYDRTNEIIDNLNNVNIYDVTIAVTGGLTSHDGCNQGNYNGVRTIAINAGPGINVTPTYFPNKVIVDLSDSTGLTAFGPTGYEGQIPANVSTAFPANDDWYLMSDASDNSLASGAGTPKRIKAQQILPPKVYLPYGFEFQGKVKINGDLEVSGTRTFVDSNDIAFEDKIIELAYSRHVEVQATGITNISPQWPEPGATFYYYDAGVGDTTIPTTIGKIKGITFSGPNTIFQLHNFLVGGVLDFAPGGYLSITGTTFDFFMNGGPTTYNSLYSDDTLDEAGIRVKGASGDKDFLWVYRNGAGDVLYNAFVASTNIGVSSGNDAIFASKFRSFGYGSPHDSTFQFMGYETGKPKIILGGSTGTLDKYGTYGYWSVQHDNLGGTSTQQPLVWKFKQWRDEAEAERFSIYSGASGPTYPTTTVSNQGNNTVTNWAHRLNVDFLDGAHATTASTAWTIPVALEDGQIDDAWVRSTATRAITRRFIQANHGMTMGDVVRINPDAPGITFAIATTVETAEALGIVSKVLGDAIYVVSEGYIDGLTGTASSNIYDILPLVTGNIYFLSPDDSGAMIANPEVALEADEIRKPMMLATGVDSGYVVSYIGTYDVTDLTDLVDVHGVHPIGMIMPYTGVVGGPFSTIPTGWRVCDGSRLVKSVYTDLFNIIGQRYYNLGNIVANVPNSGGVTGYIEFSTKSGSSLGLQVGDLLTIKYIASGGGAVEYSATVSEVLANNNIKVNRFSGITVGSEIEIYGRVGSGGTSIFFLPDLRHRTLVGSTTDLTGSYGDGFDLGENGGVTGSLISTNQIPNHIHSLTLGNVQSGTDALAVVGTNSFSDPSSAAPFSNLGPYPSSVDKQKFGVMQPYTAINWIIRAKRGLSALILSGHNHDDRYHFLQASFELTDGGVNASTNGRWGVYHRIPYNPNTATFTVPQMRRAGGQTAVFVTAWDIGNRSTESESPLQSFCYGDFTVFGDGITNTNGITAFNGTVLAVDSKVHRVQVYGHNHASSVGSGVTSNPRIEFIDYHNVNNKIGSISGLTAPTFSITNRTQDSYAVNKFYSDTSAKVIYNALTDGEDAASFTRPTGQFNVVVAGGVVSPSEKTIMSVVADTTPSGIGAKTQVHVRGDLNAWGNNITGAEGSGTLTAHNLEVFSVNTLKNEMRIYGGWTFANQQNQYPPKLSLWNRNPDVIGPNEAPIGIVEGLTAPVRFHDAVNKDYVDIIVDEIYNDISIEGDLAAKRVPLARKRGNPRPDGGLTGVAFFDQTAFDVNTEGLVTLNNITTLTIQNLGQEETPMATRSITGFNVVSTPNLVASGQPQKNVISVFIDSANNDGFTTNGQNESVQQVHINGDLTVNGDGYAVSHTNKVFEVDAKTSSIYLYGGVNESRDNLGSPTPRALRPPPRIFLNDMRFSPLSSPGLNDFGEIHGLTAPTLPHQAANKAYVDSFLNLVPQNIQKCKPGWFTIGNILIQWGEASLLGWTETNYRNNAVGLLTWPVPFSSTPFHVSCSTRLPSGIFGGGEGDKWAQYKNPTATQCIFVMQATETQHWDETICSYLAIGLCDPTLAYTRPCSNAPILCPGTNL